MIPLFIRYISIFIYRSLITFSVWILYSLINSVFNRVNIVNYIISYYFIYYFLFLKNQIFFVTGNWMKLAKGGKLAAR